MRPVSLLHSSGVDPRALDGEPAALLEPALLEFGRAGGRQAVVVPLFFGPSAALTDYLPARLESIRRQCPDLEIRCARWLVQPDDASAPTLARLLGDAVRRVVASHSLRRPAVLLVDHGSPQRGVTAVRDQLGELLARELAAEASAVGVASMERREDAEYAFNEPLLATALRTPPFDRGDVVVALQFLQSGRHAGPGGDIPQLCAAAEAEQPALRTHLTEPLANDPRLIELIAARYREAAGARDLPTSDR